MAPTIAFVTKKRDRSLFLLTHLIIKVKITVTKYLRL